MKNNHVCTSRNCDYSTNAPKNATVEDLDKIVENDGGFMGNKKSKCPKCKQDSLAFLYE